MKPGEEPTRRRIVFELVIYVLLFLLVGAAFVAFRVAREGTRVLDHDVREKHR